MAKVWEQKKGSQFETAPIIFQNYCMYNFTETRQNFNKHVMLLPITFNFRLIYFAEICIFYQNSLYIGSLCNLEQFCIVHRHTYYNIELISQSKRVDRPLHPLHITVAHTRQMSFQSRIVIFFQLQLHIHPCTFHFMRYSVKYQIFLLLKLKFVYSKEATKI